MLYYGFYGYERFKACFGLEKRDYSKERVLKFNETIRKNISEEKLNNFYEVADLITELISNKKIHDQNDK